MGVMKIGVALVCTAWPAEFLGVNVITTGLPAMSCELAPGVVRGVAAGEAVGAGGVCDDVVVVPAVGVGLLVVAGAGGDGRAGLVDVEVLDVGGGVAGVVVGRGGGDVAEALSGLRVGRRA